MVPTNLRMSPLIRNMGSILGFREAKLGCSPLQGVPVIHSQHVGSDLRQLRRREWWLWLSAFLVTSLSSVAFLLSSFPSFFRNGDHFYDLRSDQVRWGVMCLLLLFNSWLLYRHWSFRRLRRQLTTQSSSSESHTDQISGRTGLDPATGLYTRGFIEQQLGKRLLALSGKTLR